MSKTSEALASTIVAYRSLGLFKEEAREAMIELSARKAQGDDFDYEAFIAQRLEDVPKSEFDPQVMNLLSSLTHIASSR